MKTRIIISITSILIVLLLGFLSFFLSAEITEKITGKTTITRAYIHESPPVNCSVNLTQGLNMVSFPCETGIYDFYAAFSDENNNTLNFSHIFVFGAGQESPWSSYKPLLPNWTVQLEINSLDRRRGYFIFMEEAGTYHAEGLKFAVTNMALRKGWNLVGYPSTNTKEVSDVLGSINEEYVSVHSYQLVNNTKEWVHHTKGEGGTLTHFKPGYAYWILLESDATWRIEW